MLRAHGRNIIGQQLDPNIGCYMLCPFVHPLVCCWELLRKVWNLSNFKVRANGRNNSLVVVGQQCCVRLHGAYDVFVL